MKKLSKLPKKLKPSWVKLVLIVFLITAYCLLMTNLGRDPLFDWDEGIYAELGVEMIRSHDLLIPTWNNEPWLEKPPGIAWVTATSISIFGHNTFGARAFMPIFAIITLVAVFMIGKKMGRLQTGFIAIGLLTYFDLFLSRSRGVNTDGVLLAMITSTVAFSLYDLHPFFLGASIATSIMFKGPAGLFSLIIVLPLLIKKDRKYLLPTIYYLLILSIPWHLYAYLKHGQEFITPYLKEQLIRRASTPIEFHIENRYFYLTYLYENLKLGVLVVSGIGAYLLAKRNIYFPLWWVLIVVAIVSAAKTRLFWYVLPVYPAIALICAYAITNIFDKPKNKHYSTVLWVLTVGVLLQGIARVASSVELNKTIVEPEDRVKTVQILAQKNDLVELYVLVPEIERVFADIMPASQRISSTFRYGGAPNIPFYLGKPVKFFYTKEELNKSWDQATEHPYLLLTQPDLSSLPAGYDVVYETDKYLAVRRNQKYLDLREQRLARELTR